MGKEKEPLTPEQTIEKLQAENAALTSQVESLQAELKDQDASHDEDMVKALQLNEELQRKLELASSGDYEGYAQVSIKNGDKEEKVYVTQKNIYLKGRNQVFPAKEVLLNEALLAEALAEKCGAFLSEADYQKQTAEWNKKTGTNKTLEQHLGLVK